MKHLEQIEEFKKGMHNEVHTSVDRLLNFDLVIRLVINNLLANY
jgi:hypothetical protein